LRLSPRQQVLYRAVMPSPARAVSRRCRGDFRGGLQWGFKPPPTTRDAPNVIAPLFLLCSKAVFNRQCTAPGSTFSFDVKGGETEAFALLDHLQIMKLAVSFGGTDTLISHLASMTHSGIARELREEIGLTDALIRISMGIENAEDLDSDLAQGLEYV
jgi:Cys/Met metabolism PLP-dependent enzyme